MRPTKSVAERILGEYPAELARMLDFIDEFAGLKETPAQFQERCGQLALACFWRTKMHGGLDEPVFGPSPPAPARGHRLAPILLNEPAAPIIDFGVLRRTRPADERSGQLQT